MTGSRTTEVPAGSGATPDHALLEDALAAQRAGDADRAVALARRFLAVQPDRPDALQVLAVALARKGSIAEATRTFAHALTLAPDDAGLLYNYATLLRREGKDEHAIELFRRAIVAAPDHAEALYNFGHLLQTRGDLEAAAKLMQRAVAVRPLYARGWSGLATVLKALGRTEQAVAACRHAIAINPDQTVARITLANLCRDLGHAGEALEQLRTALAIEPENGPALAYLVHLLQQCCDWSDLPALGARLDAANNASIAAGQIPPEPPFAQLARIDDPASHLTLSRGWARAFDGIEPMPAPRRATADGTLRIGYLGNDFVDHPVGQLVAGLLARHDRSRFHVSAYSWGPDDSSATRRRIVAGVDTFVDIGSLDHAAAARRIRDDGIDILIDLKGHTQGHRLDVLAYRPAPVQATFLGYPGTLGAGFIDYVIADRTVLPPASASSFVEQPVWLPDSYMPPFEDDVPPVDAGGRARWRLPSDTPVLASFNNGYKIEPVMFGVWMAILQAHPGSVLWLHRYNDLVTGNLRREAAARGVDPERLVFADRPARDVHLARLALADVALDTRVFNGHATTLDALRAGLPVVTLPGRQFASRVAASLLRAAGLPELIATDLEDYSAKVDTLLRDRARRDTIRQYLRREAGPLLDPGRYARIFDRALVAMAKRYRSGLAPGPIEVPSE